MAGDMEEPTLPIDTVGKFEEGTRTCWTGRGLCCEHNECGRFRRAGVCRYWMIIKCFPPSLVGPGDLRDEIARVLGGTDIEIWGAYTGGEVGDHGPFPSYRVIVEAHPGGGGFENKREARLWHSREDSLRLSWRVSCCALRIVEELDDCVEWIHTKTVQIGDPSVGARVKALLSEGNKVYMKYDLEDDEYGDYVDDDLAYPPWSHGTV